MSNVRIRWIAVLFWSISFIMWGCGQQEPSLTATLPPSSTIQATEQPGIEFAASSPSPTLPLTANFEVTPLASAPYPEPRQESVVTKEPVFDPLNTPSNELLSTATPSALPTEAETALPPPYPGAATQGPTKTPLLPPYPVTTRTLTPTPTLDNPAQTATSQPNVSPTPTLEEGGPTATLLPNATPTAVTTSTPTLTPTKTPTPRPRIEPRQVDLACSLDEGQFLCGDEVTELSFGLPPEWVLAISGNLRPGETGVQYWYDFQRPLNAEPNMLQAGGLSRDFTDGREGLLTDFAGFLTDSIAERCAQFQGAKICEPLTDKVLLLFVFPEAERLCLDGPQFLGRPLVLIAVDLPENELITGFVFAGDFLSTARLSDYDGDLADLLESEELPGEPCDGYRQSRFTVRILELVAGVRNEILDLPTLENVLKWRQLGESLQPLEE